MGKRNSNFGKKRRKLKEPTKPILEEKGKVNFEYGGDRTEQRFETPFLLSNCFQLVTRVLIPVTVIIRVARGKKTAGANPSGNPGHGIGLSARIILYLFSKIAFKKRENERLAAENDCFIDPEQDGSDDDLEIKELPHRDFAKSLQWGKTAQKMMEKMGKFNTPYKDILVVTF